MIRLNKPRKALETLKYAKPAIELQNVMGPSIGSEVKVKKAFQDIAGEFEGGNNLAAFVIKLYDRINSFML